MNFEEFADITKESRVVPVYRRILADLLTPVGAYMRLSSSFDRTILLESIEGGKQYARYSYICLKPTESIELRNGIVSRSSDGQPVPNMVEELRAGLQEYAMQPHPDVPPFCGGWVGYMGYEAITIHEDIPVHKAGAGDPADGLWLFYDTVMAFDHLKQEAVVIKTVLVDADEPLEEQYNAAVKEIDAVGDALHTDIDYQSKPAAEGGDLGSNMTQDEFESAVVKAKEYIAAGDVFQLVLSQRFERPTEAEPLAIYRALRAINPSPYMFYMDLGETVILGASPELLVKVEEGTMEVRPIAGTRPRRNNARQDGRLAEELLADEKERAEHLMLVDLGRNDVGQVCDFGSVHVHEFMKVERFSHVMHLTSDVRGKLAEDMDIFDALLAGFPAGTVSGAPKIRAMELINELEPTRRNIYSGAVGYMDFFGNLNTCIAIRTLVVHNGRVTFQSGAGIVADSDPTSEYQETLHKAQAIIQAIEFAERGLA